jgi:hypothetical protein
MIPVNHQCNDAIDDPHKAHYFPLAFAYPASRFENSQPRFMGKVSSALSASSPLKID